MARRPATTTARTGTLETCLDAKGRAYYRGKVRLQDGSRELIEIPEQFRRSKPLAKEYLAEEQRLEDEGHALYLAKVAASRKAEALVAGAAGETCAAWYQRFMTYRRKTLPPSSVSDSFSRWHKWIEPHIGTKPIGLVTADDAEAIRDALKDAMTDGRLAPRSAGDTWIVFTVAMKHASTRRGPPELRVREAQGNPCAGIDPPPRGASKRRHWSRPAEISAVLACAKVPLAWREAIAIGCYLHLRPGELQELRVKDLDLAVGEVHVRRSWDIREKKVKAPKASEGVRHVTVPPHAPSAPAAHRGQPRTGRARGARPGDGATGGPGAALPLSPRNGGHRPRGALRRHGHAREDRLPLAPRHRHHLAVPGRPPRRGGPARGGPRGPDDDARVRQGGARSTGAVRRAVPCTPARPRRAAPGERHGRRWRW